MIRRPLAPTAAAALLLCLPPGSASAQVRASELGATRQVIDGTTLTLEYSRPVARGRSGLFGEVVHWGEVWTPGANWATTLEIDKPIRLNGRALEAGKYSIWMIPREVEPWTVLFHAEPRLFHTQRPDTTEAALRLTVAPEQAGHLETLTWSFPVVGASGATLTMQWGTTILPLRVLVEPSAKATEVRARLRRLYIGTYALSWEPRGTGAAEPEARAQASPEGAPSLPRTLAVYEEGERLFARVEPPFPGDFEPYIALFPVREHRFMPGFLMNGELVEADPEMALVFVLDGDRVVGLELQGLEGAVMARGEREGR